MRLTSCSTLANQKRHICKKKIIFFYQGEIKQTQWVDQVNEAIKSVGDLQLRKLLKKIQGHTNIPRKEKKFLNFLSCSIRVRDEKMAQRAWQAIQQATKSLKQVTPKINEEDKEGIVII